MHLPPDLLAELVAKSSPERLLRTLLRHVLLHDPADSSEPPLVETLDLAELHRLAQELLQDPPAASSRELLSRIEALPAGGPPPEILLELAANEDPDLVLHLTRNAEAHLPSQPTLALDRARLALLGAAALPPVAKGVLDPALPLAQITLGLAHRTLGQAEAARSAADQAHELADAASGVALLAYCLSLRAALALDRHRLHRALHHLDHVRSFDDPSDSPPVRARGLLLAARVLLRLDRPLDADPLLRDAAPLLDSELDRHLLLDLAYHHGHLLLDLGRISGAREVARAPHLLSPRDPTPHQDWLLGRLARRVGDLPLSARRLETAHEHASKHGTLFSSALLDLELAATHFFAGHAAPAADLIRRATPLLLQYELSPRILAELLRLGSASGGANTASDLAGLLRRLRYLEPHPSPSSDPHRLV